MSETSSQSRLIAYDVLNNYRQSNKFVSELLQNQFVTMPVSDADRRFISELVYGTVRRKATLDLLIQTQMNRPQNEIEEELWTLLQIGCYQLALMDSVPAHAAIFETVNVAKKVRKPRWTKFVNGVLRGISRNLTSEITTTPAANSFPIRNGNYGICQQNCFPNPQKETSQYFAEAFSFPLWFVERWKNRFSFAELCQIGFQFNQPMLLSLRVNLLKTSRDDLLKLFQESDIKATAGTMDEAILLEQSNTKIPQLPGFAEGLFVVQNQSAMLASSLLAPQPNEKILDLCAAPGTKTTHLAELMQNKGTLIACDVNENRLQKIIENATRLEFDIIQTHPIERDDLSTIPAGQFDAILLDVPCSNTGVLNKRPEARWRITPQDLIELSEIQLRLLHAAYDRLAENGRIVYSTCSMEPEENQNVVATFLKSHPNVTLVKEHVQTPQGNFDGAYVALLQIPKV